MSKNNDFSYDEMAYPSFVHPQTLPDRLATIAILLGLKPQSPENCRVLELGCGDGSNVIAFANSLPDSQFVGIDLSKKQIDYGNSILKSIGLKNLELIQADILELNHNDLGEFDYIIAHGVYSWTPEIVRDRVLAICREMLAEQGIAFVSYNTLPGFQFRQMARDIIIYHTRDISDPQQKIDKAVGFLEFLGKSSTEQQIYGKTLRYEFEDIIKSSAQVIYHDVLENENTPVYFHEFISHAEKHDLQFLSEVEYFTKKDANYTAEIRKLLQNFGDDLIRREQYIDFVINRRFRQTLLCRKELQLRKEPQVEFLNNLRISGNIRAKSENCNLEPKNTEVFIGGNDSQFQIDHSLTKAALVCLGETFPRSISFKELVEKAKYLLEDKINLSRELTATDEQILGEVTMQIYNVGLVKLCVQEHNYANNPGEKPLVSKLIKWQIQNGFAEITTLRFENLKIENEFTRKLLILFDGTRTREEVFQELKTDDESKFENDLEKQEFLDNLPDLLTDELNKMAGFGLFIS